MNATSIPAGLDLPSLGDSAGPSRLGRWRQTRFSAQAVGIAAALLLVGCAVAPPSVAPKRPLAPENDTHSYAEPGEVRVTHLGLALDLLFDVRRLEGTATLLLDRRAGSTRPLTLDTRNLEIGMVEAAFVTGSEPGIDMVPADAEATSPLPLVAGDPAGIDWKPVRWQLGATDPVLGTPLVVEVSAADNAVRVHYRTKPEAGGLQWLEPAQTASRKGPFLFSHSEPIEARSWIPCQDSPAVRITYDALLRVPQGLRPLMAARELPKESDRPGSLMQAPRSGFETYRFAMVHRIPSYLIALAAGVVEFRMLGPRTGVWAEPTEIDAAAWEFADIEKMLAAAEREAGPYRWGRYDILVLPPSFPMGGMENPRLTFATPTVIAGDRSLVSLIAHELAHSWSGNLVTGATWGDFWLNEGFTTYLERRIVESVYGREEAEMDAVLGRSHFDLALPELAEDPAAAILHPNLAGRDPEENSYVIAYEKGALFIRMLEETYGREAFDQFLRAWFDEHTFESLTTSQFRRFVASRLLAASEPLPGKQRPDLEEWIEGAGMPANMPNPASTLFERVDEASMKWNAGTLAAIDLPAKKWSTQEWNRFLRAIPRPARSAALAELDHAWNLTNSRNCEIVGDWFPLAAEARYEPAYGKIEEFLLRVGRAKYIFPIYGRLMNSTEGARQARAIYSKARGIYQVMIRERLDQLVGWKGDGAKGE